MKLDELENTLLDQIEKLNDDCQQKTRREQWRNKMIKCTICENYRGADNET